MRSFEVIEPAGRAFREQLAAAVVDSTPTTLKVREQLDEFTARRREPRTLTVTDVEVLSIYLGDEGHVIVNLGSLDAIGRIEREHGVLILTTSSTDDSNLDAAMSESSDLRGQEADDGG